METLKNNPHNLRGQRFGRLTVSQIKVRGVRHGGQKSLTRWWCICDCGGGRLATTSMLRSGGVTQCRVCAKPNRIGGRPKKVMAVGDVYGRLTVLELIPWEHKEGEKRTRPTARVRCECGIEKVVARNTLTSGDTKSCGCLRREWGVQSMRQNRRNRDEHVERPSYQALHDRLRRYRGRASEHRCVECGGQAQDWAYDHSDPEAVVTKVGKKRIAYSTDLSRYQPMCRRCHIQFDAAQSRNTRRAAVERQRAAQEGSGEPGLPSGA